MNTDSSRRPPGYESFFAPLQVTLTTRGLKQVRRAYEYSHGWHTGQFRADDRPYFEHPETSARIYIQELGGRDPRIITALLLHDLLEDTSLTFLELILVFGIHTAQDVRALTRRRGKEEIPEYLQRVVNRGPWAILAKLCEHLHNMRTLNACDVPKRKRKRDESRKFHSVILVTALRAYGPEWSETANYLEAEISKALDQVILH